MQDFERAILILFDQSSLSANAGIRENVRRYLEDEEKDASQHVRRCLDLFGYTAHAEVQFWCVKSIQEVIRSERFDALSSDDRHLVRERSMAWAMGQHTDLPIFTLNKIVQLLATVAAREYPASWPTFFQDVLAHVSHSAFAAGAFLRLLLAIDDEIISLDIPRSEAESRRSMEFKDALREQDIADIVAAWARLAAEYRHSQPEIAVAALACVERYTNWVDIALVASAGFVQLLFDFMAGENEELQCAAMGCLAEIAAKRMDAVPKLRLIDQLELVPAAVRWAPRVQRDSELGAKVAWLLDTLAFEVIEGLKRVENQVVSMQALGLEMDAEAEGEITSAVALATGMLDALLPAVLHTLGQQVAALSLAVVPFLTSYLARLRNIERRTGTLDTDSQEFVALLIQGIAAAARYPDDSAVFGGVPKSQQEAVLSDEEEAAMDAARQELFVLMRNAAKLAPARAIELAHSLLRSMLPQEETPSWQAAEIAVTLLYELGEALVEQVSEPHCGLFREPVTLLMSSEVPHAQHRLVAGALLECFVRYVKVTAQNGELMPSVMRAFLGASGLAHPNEVLATRACYLFMRIVKVLRQNLKAFLPELLQGLVPRLQAIVANPLQDRTIALKGTQARGAPGATAQQDDRLYAWEAMSLLLAQEDVPPEMQAMYMRGLLQQLCTQVSSNLEGDLSECEVMGASPPAPSGVSLIWARSPGPPSKAALISQALEAISRLSKGFSQTMLLQHRPEIGALFRDALSVALQVPQRLPRNKLLRSRFISYLHRMVDALGADILYFLPAALLALLHDACDAHDLSDALRLVNQLLFKFAARLRGLLAELLPPLVARVHELLPADWDWTGAEAARHATTDGGLTGSTEDVRERGALQAAYHGLVHAVAMTALLDTFTSNTETLQCAMKSTMQGAAEHIEAAVRKQCLVTLNRMVAAWQADESFRDFAVQSIGGRACLLGVLSGGVDIRDAGSLGIVQETAALLVSLHKAYGEAFLAAAASYARHRLGASDLSEESWAAIIAAVACDDAKKVKDTIRDVLKARAGVGSRIAQRTARR